MRTFRRTRREIFAGRRCLVTGAASGLGRATALELAARGAHLAVTDIDEAGLRAVVDEIRSAGGTVFSATPVDLRDNAAVAHLAAAVHAQGGPVAMVFNIAGRTTFGPVELLRHEDWRAMVDVNLMGPIHVIEHFVGEMVRGGGGGHLVNVASAAGLIGLPWHAAYSASKFGLRGVSEVLRFDLRQHGIRVTLVCPGAIATPLVQHVEMIGIDSRHPAAIALTARFARHAVTPEAAAASVLRGVQRRRAITYTSRDIHALFLLQRAAPPLYDLAMRVLNRQVRALARKAPATVPAVDGRRARVRGRNEALL